ncbi:hypothetical protein FH972_003014 [Carpinus fangiana]|uniref:glucan endo-1,3-beta-D-glucosidase n=1 Tax=Carpinus fangiana TaxID=176857 RepID=A0A5N6QK39_9ROSI|nr:hypothetical protein FH972_003014 [Carpinus fangiana]
MEVFWSSVLMIAFGIAAIRAEFDHVGVVHGKAGNDIPDANSVVELCHKYGNEAIPGTFGEYVAPAIQNIKNELLEHDVKIKLTTGVSTSVLSATFPPSNVTKEGLFKCNAELSLVVGVSGWPSGGNGNFTTPALAVMLMFNHNLMRRLAKIEGTPTRSAYPVTGFVYTMFNENMRPACPCQHFGLFNTNKTPAYRFHVPGFSQG